MIAKEVAGLKGVVWGAGQTHRKQGRPGEECGQGYVLPPQQRGGLA